MWTVWYLERFKGGWRLAKERQSELLQKPSAWSLFHIPAWKHPGEKRLEWDQRKSFQASLHFPRFSNLVSRDTAIQVVASSPFRLPWFHYCYYLFIFKSSTRLASDVSQMAVWADHENTQPRKLHFDQDYRVGGSQEVPGVVPSDDSGLNHS